MTPNRFNPSPAAQRRNAAADVTPPASSQIVLVPEVATPAPTAAVPTLQIAVLKGADTLTASMSERKPAEVGKSAGYNLSSKVYVDSATPMLVIQAGGSVITALPKHFSTGSWGWYAGGKVFVNGEECQLGANLIIVKSKGAETRPEGPVSVQVGINVSVIHSKL